MPEKNSQSMGVKNDESVTTKSNVLKFIQKKLDSQKLKKFMIFE